MRVRVQCLRSEDDSVLPHRADAAYTPHSAKTSTASRAPELNHGTLAGLVLVVRLVKYPRLTEWLVRVKPRRLGLLERENIAVADLQLLCRRRASQRGGYLASGFG